MRSETARPPSTRHFSMRFSPSRRGARAARRLAAELLAAWRWPPDDDAAQRAVLLVAELAANAALHGFAPGRDFEVRLILVEPATLRVEVTDARPDRLPPAPGELRPASARTESGRGLLLVDALADRWGVRHGGPDTKTVWCELTL
ncbi:ATP-binding protein [Streptomyces sp. B6B3]|uniref:ATP-binding protein n=1 Tax=Streptomyces sp. B6B3 TaxID=3153570 RepID=UPI00325C6EAE